MSRALRERPRVAAASLLLAVAALATAAALGGALFDGNSVSADTQAPLERAQRRAADSARTLERSGVELERLRGRLEAMRVRARRTAQSNARLRRDVRRLERALARARRAP